MLLGSAGSLAIANDAPPSAITPFHFGPADSPLFGCHHPPGERDRGVGVVICPPMGHESLPFHRALAQLAQLLAEAGCSVLRFDPFGCGDSAGACEEGRLDRWLDDVSAAIDELARRTPTMGALGLAGLRLGGSLALLTAARRDDVDRLALWDAVVCGGDHLAELAALHRRVVRDAHVLPSPDEEREPLRHLLGFPMTEALAADLEALDLTTVERCSARRALQVTSHPDGDAAPLRSLLDRLGVATRCERLPQPELWDAEEDFGKLLVPFPILRTVAQWMA